MRAQRAFALALALGDATASVVVAAPLTVKDRNNIVEMDMVAIVLISMPDVAEARKVCEEVRAFAGTFDADDWAQGHIAGCFGDVAEAEKNTAEACRLRDVQIAHYEKVMATGTDALKKNLKDGIASAKKNRAALACQ